jgi:hypothetical protein
VSDRARCKNCGRIHGDPDDGRSGPIAFRPGVTEEQLEKASEEDFADIREAVAHGQPFASALERIRDRRTLYGAIFPGAVQENVGMDIAMVRSIVNTLTKVVANPEKFGY